MIAHLRFSLHLYRYSGRWLAPCIALAVWFLFAVANAPQAFDTLAALFPAFLVISCWIAVSLGNVDDRHHREMLSAAAGSRGRLHRARALASVAICAAIAALQTTYIALVLDQPDTTTLRVIAVCLATMVGATALGAAIGSWLHPPLVARRTISLSVGLAAVTLILLLNPVQTALRELDASRVGPALLLALLATIAATVLIAGSSGAADRFS